MIERLNRVRGPVLIALLVVAIGVVVALLTPRGAGGGRFDPRSAAPDGTRALAQVLRAQGVRVDLVTDSRSAAAAAAGGATMLISQVPVMAGEQLDRVAGSGASRLVLLTPEQDQLDVLAPAVELAGVAEQHVRAPGCSLPDPLAAGTTSAGGAVYTVKGAAACYPEKDGGAGSYVRSRTPSGTEVIVLGQPGMLTNETISDRGNAALALRTLGRVDHLVWYVADPLEPVAGERNLSLTELLPGWLPWVVGQLGMAVLAAMLWRGRRLGPLVTEPLPVVVRAAETQEGRARLYRQARARDRAATTLRAASARRLSQRLAHGTGGSARELVGGVAAASGRREGDVRRLLLGPEPGTDLDLVRLADELDQLESEVARQRAAGPGRTTTA